MEGEEEERLSGRTPVDDEERRKLVKEERRKQHEKRLYQSNLFSDNDSWKEDSPTLKKYEKYRRSDREKQKPFKDEEECATTSGTSSNGMENIKPSVTIASPSSTINLDANEYDDNDDETVATFNNIRKEYNWNVSPLFSSPSSASNSSANPFSKDSQLHFVQSSSGEQEDKKKLSNTSPVKSLLTEDCPSIASSSSNNTTTTATNFNNNDNNNRNYNNNTNGALFQKSSNSSGAILCSSLSLDQTKGVLKKPTIPPILRSTTAPESSTTHNNYEDLTFCNKKPSILKNKKDDNNISFTGITIGVNTTDRNTTSSCGGGSSSSSSNNSTNNQPASVSFGLPVSKSVLTRTKSIDSNISGDTETGYWSSIDSTSGILKNRRNILDRDHSDQSLRRSSLGSQSIVSSGSESGLQSILKRKLSYDSSYIMKESNSNEYSFSTHSLPACVCLSPEPKPILKHSSKKKSSSEDLEEIEPKPILKHRNYRDYNEFSSDNSERIKPCLKKSSSKSADEYFPSSSSPIFNETTSSSTSTPVHGSSNKGILKKSGILKNTWRESSSTSNSSSSSDIENLRSFHTDESNIRRPSRNFTSDNLIQQSNSIDHSENISVPILNTLPPSTTSVQDFSTNSTDERYYTNTVENGLASNLHSSSIFPGTTTKIKNIDSFIKEKIDYGNNQPVVSVFGSSIDKKSVPTKTLPSLERKNRVDQDDDPETSYKNLSFRRSSLQNSETNNKIYKSHHDKASELQSDINKAPSLVEKLQNISSLANITHEIKPMDSKMERTDSQEDIVMSLSVAEKRSLFMQMESENSLHRKTRSKRHKTQPVTNEEVENATMMISQIQDHDEAQNIQAATTKSCNSAKFKTDDEQSPCVESNNQVVLSSSVRKNPNSKGCDNSPLIRNKSVDSSSSSSSNVNDQTSEGERKVSTPDDDESGSSTFKGELHDDGTKNCFLVSKPPSGVSKADCSVRSKRASFPRANWICNGERKPKEDVVELPKVDESSSKLSLKDRIRIFNVLATTQSQDQRLPTKKSVTSRRFHTQPVNSAQLSFQCGKQLIGTTTTTTLVTDTQTNTITTTTSISTPLNKITSVVNEPSSKNSTVRDEEGQINESECSKGLGLGDSDAVYGDCNLSHSSNKCFNFLQDFDSAPAPSYQRMPEKLSASLSSSSCSDEETNIEYCPDGDSTCTASSNISEDFSGLSRKLGKSCSVEMMSTAESESVHPYAKTKMNRNSIAEKIAALQTNGEISWKKRVPKLDLEKAIPKINLDDKEDSVPADQNDNVQLRKNNKDNSSIIANRLSQLESSQEGWKRRVEENDANIFTVQGKLEKAGKIVVRNSPTETPTSPTTCNQKVKGVKVLAPLRFRNKTSESSSSSDSNSLTSPSEDTKSEMKSSVKSIMPKKECRSDPVSSSISSDEKVIRSVTKNDNETFSKFFESDSIIIGKTTLGTNIVIDDLSFSSIQSDEKKLIGIRRNIKAPRNHSNVRNPVKSLASRLEHVEQTYSELNPQIREKENKRIIQSMDNRTSIFIST